MPNTRRNRSRKNRGLASTLYGPVKQGLGGVENVFSALTRTADGFAKVGIRGVNSIGTKITGRIDKAGSNLGSGLFSRKRRGGRRASRKNMRKSRKNMRKSRRNSRKNRRNNRRNNRK